MGYGHCLPHNYSEDILARRDEELFMKYELVIIYSSNNIEKVSPIFSNNNIKVEELVFTTRSRPFFMFLVVKTDSDYRLTVGVPCCCENIKAKKMANDCIKSLLNLLGLPQ